MRGRAGWRIASNPDDHWLDDPAAVARWSRPFVGRPRHGLGRVAINALKYAVSLALGRPRKA